MIDSHFRSFYQKILVDPLLPFWKKFPPSMLSIFAAICGIICAIFLSIHQSLFSLIFLLLSGYFDTVDGSVARLLHKSSPFGASLDIFFDRVVELSLIIAFYLFDPTRAIFCLLMLGSSYLCVTSFLVVGIFSQNESKKSFHYSVGIIERAEAFIFFSLMIVTPYFFIPLSILYSALVFLTALIRMVQFCMLTRKVDLEDV